MNMQTFWSDVTATEKLMLNQVDSSAREELDSEGFLLAEAEFAFALLPNMGPGENSSEDEIGPMSNGEKALMAYFNLTDELYVWNVTQEQWILWKN